MAPPLNFDLQIEAAAGVYRSQILNSPVGQAACEFDLPFTVVEVDRFLSTLLDDDGPAPLSVRVFGEELYAAAFGGDVGVTLLRSLDEAKRQQAPLRIRLRIDPDDPELNSLPWETLYATPLNRFLALSDDTSLIRYAELPHAPKPVGVTLPVHVLGVVSNPSDAAQLDVESEWAQLRAALAPLEAQGLIEVERLAAPTIRALQDRLRRGDAHILHFIGHGSFDEEADQGGLHFEDEQGLDHWVDAKRLGTLLHDQNELSLLFLNACEGAQAGYRELWSGTAQQLVQQGIPAVLAMQFAISDEAAITLARTFYGAIADGYSIDAAVAEARKAVYLGGSEVEWATPVLFSRSPDNRLFEFPDAANVAGGETPPQPNAGAVEAGEDVVGRDKIGRDKIGRDKIVADTVHIYQNAPADSAGSAASETAKGRSWSKPIMIGVGAVAVLLALIFVVPRVFFPPQAAEPAPATPLPSATAQTRAAVIADPTATPSLLCDDDRQCVLLAEFDPPEDELAAEVLRKVQAELTNGELLPADVFNVQILDVIRDADQVRALTAQHQAEIIIWGQIFQQFEASSQYVGAECDALTRNTLNYLSACGQCVALSPSY